LEAEKGADATEAFDELTALLGSIRDEFELSAVAGVILGEPLGEGHGIHHGELFSGVDSLL